MRTRLEISPRAHRELGERFRYIAKENESAAERFVDAVFETYDFLVRWPRAGRRWTPDHPPTADIRGYPVRGFRQYIVFYVVVGNVLRILRIMHSAQDVLRDLGDGDRGGSAE